MLSLYFSIGLLKLSSLATCKPTVYQEPAFEITNITDVVYGQGLTCTAESCTPMDLKLDVTLPKDDGKTLRPAFILMHGGGWKHGNKTAQNDQDSEVFFASRGFACFNIDYRLQKDNGSYPKDWPAAPQQLIPRMYPATRDLKAAIRFVRRHATKYGVDPDRIALSGGSAGAVSSCGAGVVFEDDYKSELLDTDPTLSTTNLEQSSKVRAVVSHWGGSYAIQMAEVADPKKRWRYGPNMPAMLEFHGDQDHTVPLSAAQAVQSGYKTANTTGNLTYEMHVLSGCAHAAWCYGCDNQCKCTAASMKKCNALDTMTLPFLVQHLDLTLASAATEFMQV